MPVIKEVKVPYYVYVPVKAPYKYMVEPLTVKVPVEYYHTETEEHDHKHHHHMEEEHHDGDDGESGHIVEEEGQGHHDEHMKDHKEEHKEEDHSKH